ncbi:hypothetical protein ACHAXN_007862 [Cyclotella atomus]
MRILGTLLVIAGVVTANNLRGEHKTPESRELQTVLDHTGSSTWRGTDRRTGTALFIVEDGNDRSTTRCADDTADEFEDYFDDIFIVDNEDEDAQNGDVVAVIDGDTDCDRLWDDIYDEVDQRDQHSTNTVYVYYGSGSRYYRNRARSKRGYRLYYGRYGRNRNRSRKYWGGGWGRGWGRNHYWNHHDNDNDGGGWHHDDQDDQPDEQPDQDPVDYPNDGDIIDEEIVQDGDE